MKPVASVIFVFFFLFHCIANAVTPEELALLGHRNIIVVADSAYPLQSNPAIETRHIGGEQIERIIEILAKIQAAPHVNPIVMVDAELEHVAEEAAPGIAAYRAGLDKALEGAEVRKLPHIDIIRRLDESAQLFKVIILKTDAVLPYTSVFFELDCGYWNAEKEKSLREAMGE
ncbi:MAG: RbsD/FucU domain-containing protein [Luteolibacter sp.]|jgi:hypothetical protein